MGFRNQFTSKFDIIDEIQQALQMKSKSWNWKECSNPYWKEPAQEVYYLADRWSKNELEKLLDLGCGIGRQSIYFSTVGFDVCAYDLSDEGVKTLIEEG